MDNNKCTDFLLQKKREYNNSHIQCDINQMIRIWWFFSVVVVVAAAKSKFPVANGSINETNVIFFIQF